MLQGWLPAERKQAEADTKKKSAMRDIRMNRPSFPRPHDPRAFRNAAAVREDLDRQARSPRGPSHDDRSRSPELPHNSPIPKPKRVLSDAELDAFLPEEDELDPYPEPGDFWTCDE